MNLKQLPFANLSKHPGRTAGLIILVALLAFTMYGGTMLISSLRNGLSSLEGRLGADLMVVPDSARSTAELEDIVLNGVPGYFYMSKSYLDKISAVDGVEKVSPQYFLASAKAGCCSMPVQIIGIDEASDFTIKPWIDHSYSNTLNREEVIVGSNITGAPGSLIMFYGVQCTIVAKLDETGTKLDNAVFTSCETAQDLLAGSREQGISILSENDPAQVISAIQVKVKDGYNISDVVDDVNLHVRGVDAVQTKSMLSGVSSSMDGVAGTITVLMVVLWVLAIAVMVVAFFIIARFRVKEFAVLRVLGASRKALTRIVLKETAILSALGAVAGIVVANVIMFAFGTSLEDALGLPFLTPSPLLMIALAALAFVVSMLAACIASAASAVKLGRVDAGQTLREE